MLSCCCTDLCHQRSLGLTPPCWRQHLASASSSSHCVLLGSFVVTGVVAASGSGAHLSCIFHAGVWERHMSRRRLCRALASGQLRCAGFPNHISQAQVVPSGASVGWVLHPGQKVGLRIGAWGTSIQVTEFVRELKSACQSSQSSHQPGILMKWSRYSV